VPPRKYFFSDEDLKLRNSAQRILAGESGYKGVEFRKDRGKWRAYIGDRRCGNLKRLGHFDSAEEAALAYDEAAKERYGDDAFLNFPLNGEKQGFLKREVGYCAYGHEMTADNSYLCSRGGEPKCRRCAALSVARYLHRKKQNRIA
jgi:hypothetical protein